MKSKKLFAGLLCLSVSLLLFTGEVFGARKLSFGPEKTFTSLSSLGISSISGQPSGNVKTIHFSINKGKIKWIKFGKFDILKIKGLQFKTEPGSPMLPAKVFTVNLPKGSKVSGVGVTEVRYCEILNSLEIIPSPHPVRITPTKEIKGKIKLKIPLEVKEEEKKVIYRKNKEIYSQKSYFPSTAVKWHTGKDQEKRMVYIHFYPFYYNPGEKKTFVITSATIKIYYQLPEINTSENSTLDVPTPDYELLIITPFCYRDLARKLQDLHNNDPYSPLRTCYVYLEDIDNFYFSSPYHPDPGNPPYDPSPGNVYPDNRTLARKIVRFLREMATQYIYAPYHLLHPIPESNVDVKFQYVLILGRGDIVPPSWYPWYSSYTFLGWLATDFFYASPDYDLLPEFAVGRIPLVEEERVSGVFTIDGIDDEDLKITTYGSLPEGVQKGDLIKVIEGTQVAPIFFEIVDIEDNSPTNFILTLKETDSGPEPEEHYFGYLSVGNKYQFHKNIFKYIYLKEKKWMDEVNRNLHPNVWTEWFRNVALAGGATFGTSYYWHELVVNQYLNNGHFEGNRIVKKLFRTNPEDSDFDKESIEPFLNDTGEDVGLFYIGCHGSGCDFIIDKNEDPDSTYYPDGKEPAYISSEDLKSYTSNDNKLPMIVSVSCLNGIFDTNVYFYFYTTDRSLGEAVVNAFDEEKENGSVGICYIGGSRECFASISAYFEKGVIHPFSDTFKYMDQMLNYTMEYWHLRPRYIGDIFVRAIKGTNENPEDCFIAQNDFSETLNRYTLFEYTLLGDPALPIPYPYLTPIYTGTQVPQVEIEEESLREVGPKYESHDVPVDEIPEGGSASTMIKITPADSPSEVTTTEIKIKKVDCLEVPGRNWYEYPAADFNYTFETSEDEPGYYMVAITQKGWDSEAGNWGDWWEKETRIYIQEVNQLIPTTDNILVVDDDYGFPFYLRDYPYYIPPKYYEPDSFEDFYQKSLINLANQYGEENYVYDLWHVDFDDTEDYPGTAGDYNGNDVGYTRMYGEVFYEKIKEYKKTIWLTGNKWPKVYRLYGDIGDTITSPEENALSRYLDEGGTLFVSGQDILWDCGVDNFIFNYLKTSGFHASIGYGGKYTLDGVKGDPISSGLRINIAGGDGANNQYIFNVITPTEDGYVTFVYIIPSGANPPDINPPYYAAVYGLCGNNGGTVFFPWGWESIDRQDERDDILRRVLNWLTQPTIPAGYITAVPGDAQVTLNWTAPAQAEGVLILYNTTSYPTGVPQDGNIYNQGDTIGDGTVAYVGGGTSYIHTGLTNGTTYYYVAYWYDSNYNYTELGRTSATPVEGGGGGYFNATGGDAQVTLEWSLPEGDTGILILYSTSNYPTGTPEDGQTYSQGATIGDGTVVYVGGGTSYIHSGLPNGVTFYYVAYSYDQNYNYSFLGQDSATTYATGAVFTAIPGDSQVLLEWIIPAGREGVLIIFSTGDYPTGVPQDGESYSQGESIGDGVVVYVGSETSYIHTGLTNGTTYYYVAYSYDTVYYYYMGQASATPTAAGPGPDGDPENLVAIAGKKKVTLQWNDKSTNEQGFVIERKSETTGYIQIKAVGANVKNYTDTDVTPGVTYTYRVRAFNEGGYSNYTNEASATPYAFSVDEVPEIISAKRELSGLNLEINIILNWRDKSADEEGFEVWRKDGEEGEYKLIDTVGPGSGIIGYLDGDSNLQGGITYFYKVRAYGSGQYSEFSIPYKITPSAFPDGQDPTDLRAVPGINCVTLQWMDNSTGDTPEERFEIEISLSPNFDEDVRIESIAAHDGVGQVSYTVENLAGGYTYYFRVKAYRSEGYSNYANCEGEENIYYVSAVPYSFEGGGGGGGCFIATAAFGSPLSKYVIILKKFRDKYLIPSYLGRKFVSFYYKTSPPVARFLKKYVFFKLIVRILLYPVVGLAFLILKGYSIWLLSIFCLYIYLLLYYRVKLRYR